MKNNFLKTSFSFFLFYLFACIVTAAVLSGILLMPLFFITVLVLAIREIIIWNRNTQRSDYKDTVMVKQEGATIVRSMPPRSRGKKAA